MAEQDYERERIELEYKSIAKKMSELIIYQNEDNQTEISVQFEDDTFWLSQKEMATLFGKNSDTIGLHLKNIYNEKELIEISTTEFFSEVRKEGKRNVTRDIKRYYLDAIISVAYRVNSKRGTEFRQWATKRLNDYLVKGYAINENRLKQKQQEVEYLKTGIRILSRTIEEQVNLQDNEEINPIIYISTSTYYAPHT